MKILEKLRNWVGASDEEKMRMDRRAFLKGMAVTSAGLLVPGATVFDLGRRRDKYITTFEEFEEEYGDFQLTEVHLVKDPMFGPAQSVPVADPSGFQVGDWLSFSGVRKEEMGVYQVEAVSSGGVLTIKGAS